jgi:FRG domain
MIDESESCETIPVSTWNEYDEVVNSLPQNKWVYRGHSEAFWTLETSLYRTFRDALPIIKASNGTVRDFARDKHEKFLLQQFQRSAHLYQNSLPQISDKLEWLAIMQHYGAPTRLMDVTLSPHIAAYFAMEHGNKDSAVYAFDHDSLRPNDMDLDKLKQNVFDNMKGEKAYTVLYIPKATTERLLAQQGAFLVPSNNYESIDEIVVNRKVGKKACKKIIIDESMRYKGIERLRKMNLTSTALFPGIDGFCRSLRFQIMQPTQTQGLLH